MRTNAYLSRKILYFSQWSGKGYAVFAGLGRQVQIAFLALHICLLALLKSARKGVIVNCAAVWKESQAKRMERQRQEMLLVCYRQGEVCPGKNEMFSVYNL